MEDAADRIVPRAVVVLTQLVETPSDYDDRVDLNLGQGKERLFNLPAWLIHASDDEILDWFHSTIPIARPEEYFVEVQ